jgi:hypothetical protein
MLSLGLGQGCDGVILYDETLILNKRRKLQRKSAAEYRGFYFRRSKTGVWCGESVAGI